MMRSNIDDEVVYYICDTNATNGLEEDLENPNCSSGAANLEVTPSTSTST